MTLLLILISVVVIVLLITKLKLHPFLALLFVSIGFGIATGMKTTLIITSIQEGFGGTLGKIGLIIILGVIIGAFLEHTGGALKLAEKVLQIIGPKRVTTAMGIIGYIVSIPVFSDSGFILLSSLNKNLTKKAGLSLAGTAIALGLGLSCTHALVPPTPGPIAAAGILNADLGLVMLLGLFVAAIALIAALIFAKKVASKVYLDPDFDHQPQATEPSYTPSLLKSSFPIIIPILLIVLKSLSVFLANAGWQLQLKNILSFIGEPVIALIIGFFFCLLLPKKLERIMLSTDGWAGKALKDSATIILITGAGGIFGKVLQNSDLATIIGDSLATYPVGIWLPFLLAAAFKSAQGSSTVSLITTASIMVSLMAALGLTSEMDKAMVVIAIGAGSLIVSHANDSFFWVVTQMSGMDVKTGYKLHTTGMLVIGSVAMICLYILFIIFH
ncbi:MAG TPA: GntP family permease [Chitinophagaceae bacterium]|nr:GntP family permease [Chitinophagaceae bacterium]